MRLLTQISFKNIDSVTAAKRNNTVDFSKHFLTKIEWNIWHLTNPWNILQQNDPPTQNLTKTLNTPGFSACVQSRNLISISKSNCVKLKLIQVKENDFLDSTNEYLQKLASRRGWLILEIYVSVYMKEWTFGFHRRRSKTKSYSKQNKKSSWIFNNRVVYK